MKMVRIGTPARLLLSLVLGTMLMFDAVGSASASGFVIYVKWNASGANNGSSWSSAYKSLQSALGAAVYGQQIWVAAGTYKPGTTPSSSFILVDGVGVYGGFAGGETLLSQRNPALHETILSGEIGAAGSSDNINHVVTALNVEFKTILDGFTITGGYDYGVAPYSGGGLYAKSSNATLRNLTFSGNSAGYGGGMDNEQGSPTMTNIVFVSNKGGLGGGMSNDSGAPNMTNVTFSGNTSNGSGGGLWTENSSPVLTNTTFRGNHSLSGTGNALYNGGVTAYPKIYDSIFWGDGSPEISFVTWQTPTIANSIVAGGCPIGALCMSVLNADPHLGPLQNNGGSIKTMALGAGSVAIDKGNNSTCAPTDARGVSRPQAAQCDIGAYEVKVASFVSAGAYDGWVLESSENSSLGGSMNSTASTLRVGDDAANRQYRGLLSFNTASLADGATVVLARLRVMRQGLSGTNPFTTHGNLVLDAAKPYFGTGLALAVPDFQATATASPAGTIGSTLAGGWYTGPLNSAGRAALNKTGTTQFRLRFSLDDNNDGGADYLSLYSGNATTSSYRPRLIVYYNP